MNWLRPFAIVAMSFVVGCSAVNPPTPTPTLPLHIYTTIDAAPFLAQLIPPYQLVQSAFLIETQVGSDAALLDQLQRGETAYFISHHLPTDTKLWSAPVAQDALALIVNAQNPLTDITTAEIRELYQGFYGTWAEFNNWEENLHLYSYETEWSIRAEFDRLVMGQRLIATNTQVIPSAAAAVAVVSKNRGGLAYIPYSQVTDEVKIVAVNGSLPSVETIQERRYPLPLTLYLIGLSAPSANYADFLAWIQSPEGQVAFTPPYVPLP